MIHRRHKAGDNGLDAHEATARNSASAGTTGRNGAEGQPYLAIQRLTKGTSGTKPLIYIQTIGGEDEDRTHDLRIANAALSQLSYPPRVF